MRRNRTKRIVVRVSADEHRAITEKAKEAGMPLSVLVRSHLDRLRVYNYADKERWIRASIALHHSAANLARVATALQPCDAATTLAYLAAIHRDVRTIVNELPKHAREILPSRRGES